MNRRFFPGGKMQATSMLGRPSGPQYETPSYDNAGGMGDRASLVVVTTAAGLAGNIGAAPYLLADGDREDSNLYIEPAGAVTGLAITFTFLNKVIINEAKFYQGLTPAATHGTWIWQCDPEGDGMWQDVGSGFTFGGGAIQTQTSLAGNTTPAIAYRVIGVSGNANAGGYGYWNEFEFSIGNPA